MGKSTINGQFSIAILLVYQDGIPHVFHGEIPIHLFGSPKKLPVLPVLPLGSKNRGQGPS
jgi:TctA family transporter